MQQFHTTESTQIKAFVKLTEIWIMMQNVWEILFSTNCWKCKINQNGSKNAPIHYLVLEGANTFYLNLVRWAQYFQYHSRFRDDKRIHYYFKWCLKWLIIDPNDQLLAILVYSKFINFEFKHCYLGSIINSKFRKISKSFSMVTLQTSIRWWRHDTKVY